MPSRRLEPGPALAGALLAVAAAAACGPAGGGRGPAAPMPGAASAGAASPAGQGAAPPPAGASTDATARPEPDPHAAPTREPVPMKPLVASAMEAELREIGIDPRALPPLDKLEPEKLRKVMKKFTKALGVPCSHCHDTKDFRAPTPNKKLATHMWNDFTRGLAIADASGKPDAKAVLFCDSCHGGRATLLDRRDLAALGDYMTANYEAKLVRTDRKEHTCGTCHGDPFEGKIFARLWR
jgi:hypothetical protein